MTWLHPTLPDTLSISVVISDEPRPFGLPILNYFFYHTAVNKNAWMLCSHSEDSPIHSSKPFIITLPYLGLLFRIPKSKCTIILLPLVDFLWYTSCLLLSHLIKCQQTASLLLIEMAKWLRVKVCDKITSNAYTTHTVHTCDSFHLKS